MNTVDNDHTSFRRPRNPSPTTPIKRGRGRNQKPYPDISVESPYFSPSKERPPRPKGENFLIVERRLQLTTTKTDQTVTTYTDRSLDSPHNYVSESDDPFEATQTRIPASPSPASVSGLYRQLALCKPYLIQECISDDPWKVLVAVTLLNKTSGKLGIPAFWTLISKWPTPLELSQAKEEEVIAIIRHLGTQSVRSRRLILLSRVYLQQPPSIYDLRSSKSTKICSPSTALRTTSAYPATPISHLPGTGRYALDSYRIFCTQKHDLNSEEWKTVLPTDKELVRYLRWKWAYCESKAWSPTEGVLGDADAQYLTALIHDLESSIP